MSTLVAYFSYSGVTRRKAESLAKEFGANTFEIKAKIPYTSADVNWQDDTSRNVKEYKDAASRPEIEAMPDLSGVDKVYIGAPVWWGDWPMICYTYFEANDFSGKTLIPFSTHEGSGLSGFDTKLSGAAPGADVKAGLAIRGQDAQNKQSDVRADVKEWLAGLGF